MRRKIAAPWLLAWAGCCLGLGLSLSNLTLAQTVTDLAVGDQHSCALKEGKVYCWGGVTYTGHDNPPAHLLPQAVATTPYPVKSANGFTNTNVIQIAGKYNHTCAIEAKNSGDTSGVLYCWGANGETGQPALLWPYGALGNGTTAAAYVPTKVLANDGFTNTNVTHVATGWTHTCAIEGGVLYCWGNNLGGALGDGTGQPYSSSSFDPPSAPALSPRKVPEGAGTTFVNSNVTQVATGYVNTCAVQGGRLYCWGLNDRGQLGINDFDPFGAGPRGDVAWTVPNEVLANGNFSPTSVSAVDANNGFVCAISGGEVSCWGWGSFGRLGDNATDNKLVPTAVPMDEGLGTLDQATAITLGDDFGCALSSRAGETTQAYCWGAERYGQTGLDNPTGSFTYGPPGIVSDGILFDSAFVNTDVQLIQSGRWHSCAVQGDEVYCWGKDTAGDLGRGYPLTGPGLPNLGQVASPIPVLPLVVPRDTTAVNKILAYDGTNAAPEFSDYEAAIVPGALTGRVSTYNTALVSLDPSEMSEVDTMVAAYNAILDAAGDPTAASNLEAADYEALGLTLDDPAVLDFVNATIGAGVEGDFDLWSEVQTLFIAANRIWAYAASKTGAETPLFSDYEALGLTEAQVTRLISYNSAVKEIATSTRSEVEDAVTAYNSILDAANDEAASALLTGATYQDVGVLDDEDNPLDGEVLGILNSSVGRQDTSASDTVPELQAMATAANRITALAAGDTITLEVADFTALGIQGVTEANLVDVQTAIGNAGGGSLDSVPDILALIEAFISDPEAVQALVDYDGTTGAPSAQIYDDAGVVNVNGDRLAIYNNYLAQVRPTDLEEIQAMVDAVNAIVDAAGDQTASSQLTEADYEALGMGLFDPAVLPFLNEMVANTAGSEVDTAAELQALVDRANRLWAWAADQPAAETPVIGDYEAIAIERLVSGYTGAYNSGIQSVATTTPAEVQVVVDAYNTILSAATESAPVTTALDDYTDLGVIIDSDALTLVDSVVNDAVIVDVDTVPKLQALVNAAERILQTASNSSDAGLSVADFRALGLSIGDEALELAVAIIEAADLVEVQTKEGLLLLLAGLLIDSLPIPSMSLYGLLMLSFLILFVSGLALQSRQPGF